MEIAELAGSAEESETAERESIKEPSIDLGTELPERALIVGNRTRLESVRLAELCSAAFPV